jgi:hypothetical protein
MTGRVIAGEKQGQSWTDYRGPFATPLASGKAMKFHREWRSDDCFMPRQFG